MFVVKYLSSYSGRAAESTGKFSVLINSSGDGVILRRNVIDQLLKRELTERKKERKI